MKIGGSWAWRSQPCTHLASVSLTRPEGSPASTTFLNPGSNRAAATPRPGVAHPVTPAPDATPSPPAPCTTSATPEPAGERSNPRYPKAQQAICIVRSRRHRAPRIAPDRNRELRVGECARTVKTLHRARSDPDSGHRRCGSVPKSEHARRQGGVLLVLPRRGPFQKSSYLGQVHQRPYPTFLPHRHGQVWDGSQKSKENYCLRH